MTISENSYTLHIFTLSIYLQKADFLRCGAFVEIDVHDVASRNQ